VTASNHIPLCATTWRPSARPRTAASSPVCGAASCPPSPTAAPGPKPDSWPSPQRSKPLPCPAAIQPAARLPVHLAERRRLPHPGGRVGRARRGRTAAHLRQVHRGPGRARQAPHRRSPAPGLRARNFGTYLAQRPASDGAMPHIATHRHDFQDRGTPSISAVRSRINGTD